MHFHVTRYIQSNTHSFIDKTNVAKPRHTTSPSADRKVLNFILHILNIRNGWIKDKISSQISRSNMSQVTIFICSDIQSSIRVATVKYMRRNLSGPCTTVSFFMNTSPHALDTSAQM